MDIDGYIIPDFQLPSDTEESLEKYLKKPGRSVDSIFLSGIQENSRPANYRDLEVFVGLKMLKEDVEFHLINFCIMLSDVGHLDEALDLLNQYGEKLERSRSTGVPLFIYPGEDPYYVAATFLSNFEEHQDERLQLADEYIEKSRKWPKSEYDTEYGLRLFLAGAIHHRMGDYEVALELYNLACSELNEDKEATLQSAEDDLDGRQDWAGVLDGHLKLLNVAINACKKEQRIIIQFRWKTGPRIVGEA